MVVSHNNLKVIGAALAAALLVLLLPRPRKPRMAVARGLV